MPGDAGSVGFQFAFFVIHGIADNEGDLAFVQFLLRHGPGTAPVLAGPDSQCGRAELIHLLPAGIVQGYRSGEIAFTRVAHRNGNRDGFGLGESVVAQFHIELQRIVGRQRRTRHQKDQRDAKRQYQPQPFSAHNVSEPPLLPPSSGGCLRRTRYEFTVTGCL